MAPLRPRPRGLGRILVVLLALLVHAVRDDVGLQAEEPVGEDVALERYRQIRRLEARLDAEPELFDELRSLWRATLDEDDQEERTVRKSVYYASKGLARALAGQADRARERMSYLASLRTSAMALETWSGVLSSTFELARWHLAEGRLHEARELLEEALASPARDKRGASNLFVQLAQILNVQMEWDASRACIDQAEAAVPTDHPLAPIELARIAGLRAEVFLRMGLIDQGAVWSEREWSVLRDSGAAHRNLRVRALIHRSNVHLATEDWHTVVREVRAELDRDDAAALDPDDRVLLLNRLATALASLERADAGRPREAEQTFRRVLAAEPSPFERRAARIRLAQLYLEQDRTAEARELVDLMRETGSLSTLEDAHLAAVALRVEMHPYRDLASRRHRSARTADDPPELEAGRRDRIDALLARLQWEYSRVVADWNEVGLRAGGVGLLRYETVRYILSAYVDGLLAGDDVQEGMREALETLFEAQNLSTLARSLDCPEAILDDARDLLAASEGMLFYLPSVDRTHVFAVDRSGTRHFLAASRPAIEAVRVPFVETVTTSPHGLTDGARAARIATLREIGGELRDALLPDDLMTLVSSWKELTIVGPELLGYVPFECLPTGDSWLGITIAVGYSPSIPVALGLARRRAARSTPAVRDAFILAAPAHAAGLPSHHAALPELPFDESRRQRLIAPYDPERVEVVRGPEARFEALASRGLDAAVSHLLVHGIHDYSRERTAGLLLAPHEQDDGSSDSGAVWADRLASLDVRGLWLLTACGSGQGPARWGDSGSSDLGGILMAAGADTVVLPYAELAYEATLDLSAGFHRHLRDGLGPAEAMRRARREVAAMPGRDDPFYHGLLHTRGLPHAAPFIRRTERPIPILLVIVSAVAIGASLAMIVRSRSRPRAHRHHRTR